MTSLPGPTGQPILEGLWELPGWKSSQAAGLMTWEAALQKAGCRSACFPHPHRSTRNFINWCSGAKEGMFLALGCSGGSQPASSQADLPSSQLGPLQHWPALNQTHSVCSIQCAPSCLPKESSVLQISIPSAPREGGQEWPRAGKGPSLSELPEAATELFRPSCWRLWQVTWWGLEMGIFLLS